MSAVLIRAERKRKLQSLSFVPSSLLSRDLPKDTVVKGILLRLNGAVQCTITSGTPISDPMGTFARLIPNVQVTVDGSRSVKSVNPYIMQQMQLLATGVLGERKSSAAAGPVTNPTVDANFTFGTTGQYTSVAETVRIYFEDPMIKVGKDTTFLNLGGRSSAEIKFNTTSFANLQRFDDTAVMVYANNTLAIDITLIEAQDRVFDAKGNLSKFYDLKETTKDESFSSEQTKLIDVNRGNFLRGLVFLVRDGDTTKALSNNAIDTIKLMLNGSQIIQSTTFRDIQAEMRARAGLNVPYASNVSRLDGFAHMDLLQDGDINTALEVSQRARVDNVQIEAKSAASGAGATYTNAVVMTLMTQEIVPVVS